jgi:hypothetical protein
MKQIGVGGCGCGLVSQVGRKIGEHSLDVVPHVHSNPVITINKGHTEILVDLPTRSFDITVLAVFVRKPFEEMVIDCRVNVARFQVVNVDFDSMLRTINFSICNARIIWVELESYFF